MQSKTLEVWARIECVYEQDETADSKGDHHIYSRMSFPAMCVLKRKQLVEDTFE